MIISLASVDIYHHNLSDVFLNLELVRKQDILL